MSNIIRAGLGIFVLSNSHIARAAYVQNMSGNRENFHTFITYPEQGDVVTRYQLEGE